ncbi:MAG: excinuclease subunit [Bacteroidetes bacterium]|jgi:excinuclease ABC subunit C|nr:excinuclease subunit [Bacteroidota bacterium]
MQKPEHIQNLLRTLPDSPGVYQYYDSDGKIIYVGKAKSLKKRVASYFNKDQYENGKTMVLVKKIADIKYIIVNTEIDALLLENNLIKKYQPRYNVMLKDDKTYPWICIKNERFPRVFSTRNVIRDGSTYFGPYASVRVMNMVLELIRQLFNLRNCNYQLTEDNIKAGKFKVCLEYHIGNCAAPCVGKETEEEYNQTIAAIKDIVKGNANSVAKYLKDIMQEQVEKMQYEKAQLTKEKIDLLEKFQSKSTVVHPTISNVDVYSIITDERSGYVNFLKIMNGSIVQSHTIELKKKLDESPEELLTLAIIELRERFESHAKEIIIPFEIELGLPDANFFVPQRGDKKQLLELSERNVDYFRKDKIKQESLIDPERHTKRILEQMKKDLHLAEEPRHIECFDNSNFQGAYPVAAMTVFKDTKPSKKDYRHFNIKTVEGPDDFASMEEIIYRRYKRVLEENSSLPQLIVIDGGKGQLSSALESLEKLGLRGKVGIIGIAKKLEEIYFPGDSIPLYLDKRSETLKIIQQIRDEAHRFGITHHRKRRDKGTLKTELTEIKGISDTTANKLLSHFKSVKGVKEASEEDLTSLVGKVKAKLIIEFYKNKIAG